MGYFYWAPSDVLLLFLSFFGGGFMARTTLHLSVLVLYLLGKS